MSLSCLPLKSRNHTEDGGVGKGPSLPRQIPWPSEGIVVRGVKVTFVAADEPMRPRGYELRSAVSIQARPWRCAFCGFGQTRMVMFGRDNIIQGSSLS